MRLSDIIAKLRNTIKLGKIVSVDDSGDIRTAKVSTLGKQQQVQLMMPYGDMGSPPPGSLVVMYAIQGHESSVVALADDPINRTHRDMQPGERALGNYITGSNIRFVADGAVEITSQAGSTVVIDAGGNIIASATADITATAAGNVTITSGASNVQITGNTTITGDTIIIGDLTVTGVIGCTGLAVTAGPGGGAVEATSVDCVSLDAGSATISGRAFISHQHSGVTSGGDDTGGVV